MTYNDLKEYLLLRSHCSALIKLSDDMNDIFIGHNTWTTYS